MNIARWKVYIKPFVDSGEYADDYTEVTEDADQNSLGTLSEQLDNSDYDFGVYRNSGFQLTLRNNEGKYSDVNNSNSMFRTKRSNSLVKLTFQVENDGPYLGDAILGDAYLSDEVQIFVGLLSDESLSMDIDTLEPSFQVLGRESIFDSAIVPIDDIADGEALSSIIYKCLNQSIITQILNISPSNINLGLDETCDFIDSLTGKTVSDAVNEILKITNSILYVDGDDVIIAPRVATASIIETFYGQASNLGPENIQGIKNIKTGLARTFNYLTWDGSTSLAKDDDSIRTYGIRSSQVSSDLIVDTVKQTNLLAALVTEFSIPQQEFDLIVPTTYENLALKILSRITVDYPTVYLAKSGDLLPICGIAICGQAILPKGLWAFTISPLENLKMIGRSIDQKSGLITFRVRGIPYGS